MGWFFTAPHQELNCTYNTENSDTVIETIETVTSKLSTLRYHTYQSYQRECQNMLDLLFADQLVFKFFDTFYISDDFGSDHRSTITTLNIVAQSRFDLKAKIFFKKFKHIVRQQYGYSVLYPTVYPKAEQLIHLNEVLVQIIQSSLQKSYILQKIYPFRYETTKLIREKKKKRRELKRTNGEQIKFLKKEINFLQKEKKRSMKRSEKIEQSKLIARAQNQGSKSFCRAVETLYGDSKKPNEIEQSVEVSYKQTRAKTRH